MARCDTGPLRPLRDHLGHGVENEDGRMFCSAHCAREVGVSSGVRA